MGKEGSVLVPVLVVCLVFATTLAAGYRESRQEMMITRNYLQQQKLFYLAEAGLVKGFWMMSKNPDWTPEDGFFEVTSGRGFYLKRREKDGGKYLISRGVFKEGEVVLTAKFEVNREKEEVNIIWWKEGFP